MAGNFKKEDLRIQKTHKFLHEALAELLKIKKFKNITVNDLCELALISRAAFYSHYKDKYDLLEAWLMKKIDVNTDNSALLERIVFDNTKSATNLITDADEETLNILCKFLAHSLIFDKAQNNSQDPEYLIFVNFYTGGMLRLLACQVDNSYPDLLGTARGYFFAFIDNLKQFYQKNSELRRKASGTREN